MDTTFHSPLRAPKLRWFGTALMVAIVALAVGCSEPAPDPTQSPNRAPATSTDVPPTVAPEPISIVATSNIIGEWVSIVAGDRADVFNLVPAGVDPHAFRPGARDIAQVADADLVFAVGISLEQGWLSDLVENAAADHDGVIELGQRIDPLEFSFETADDHDEGDDENDEEEEGVQHDEDDVEIHNEDDGHGHGKFDPHFWFDPERVIVAVRQIAKELTAADPASADYYNANRDTYIAQIQDLDTWIVDQVATIDDDDRLLATTHDSFSYFADRYGFDVAGVIIPGGGTELERSPQELAELVEEVEEQGATVVFAEAQLSDRLASTLAREAGIEIIGGLYTGSLGGDDSNAATYIDMMRSNVGIIVETLQK